MVSTPLGGCTGLFLKKTFSNFCSHIIDSKWGRKWISINCTSCNRSLQEISFQFANGELPHSRCRAFLAKWPKMIKLQELSNMTYTGLKVWLRDFESTFVKILNLWAWNSQPELGRFGIAWHLTTNLNEKKLSMNFPWTLNIFLILGNITDKSQNKN